MNRKQKIGLLSLGCPRNLVDSENIAGRLRQKGHSIVDIEKADVAIINTCAFIEEAKRESIESILDLVELKKEGRLKKIIVYGCLPQRYKHKLRQELPECDAFVGRISLNHSRERFPITPRHYAYLKICEGCINPCSFCAIPRIKGKFSSLDKETLLRQVERLDQQKVSEINCVGQDLTAYGTDLYGAPRLAEILREITARMKNAGWLRLLYLYPNRLTDDVLQVIRDEPKICKYIDVPIQHISDRILRQMRRGTKKKDILKLIDKIRKTIPGVALRTSVIVGFPSETQKEFQELLSFLKDVRFERLGAFTYSREEGTLAYRFKGQISPKIKTERLNQVMACQQEIATSVNAQFLGKTLEVLIDAKEKDGYLGRTPYDAPEVDGQTFVKSKRRLSPGDFVPVKITDTLEYDLVGEA